MLAGRHFMPDRQKLLLLDDDQDLLELYKEILGQLPSQPEIHIASSGARAISLLESDHFALLISDLNMPKMDGLQVLTIVRRKFPNLRTAVMTAVADEQFRARAYSMGIDLFLEKPNTSAEVTFFLDCIESLLGKNTKQGFRGIQSKSLVDIIQLECLSGGSSVLKITNGAFEGRVWLQAGEIVDASAAGLSGQPAFQKIMSWKTGNFEILPADPGHERTIFIGYQGLLLETAQAIDEAGHAVDNGGAADDKPLSKLAALGKISGVAFAMVLDEAGKEPAETWGVSNSEAMNAWLKQVRDGFDDVGRQLGCGTLARLEGFGSQNHLAMEPLEGKVLCVGFDRSLGADAVRESFKTALVTWAS